MKLEGSCACGAVHFSLQSAQPVPYMRCYCSICRKTAGGGGYAINLGGEHASLRVRGRKHVGEYRARIKDKTTGRTRLSPARRHFCSRCGSALWAWDPRWPELVHPQASAIDTPLPVPPQQVHIMLGSKAAWVEVPAARGDQRFDEYPQESLAAWHERLGLTSLD
ncbi:MAG: GFA family protein [Nevskia sp.]